MSIEHAILGLLSWRSLAGYDIKKLIAGSPVLYWSGNNNQIYTTLVRLHKSGLVSQEIEPQEDRPARKIYTLTASGRQELRAWLLSAPEPPQLKNTFLIQLAWADQLNLDELLGLIDKYEDEIQMQLSMLQVQAKQNNRMPSGQLWDVYINPSLARTSREAVLWDALQESWIAYYKNEIDWVHRLHHRLESN